MADDPNWVSVVDQPARIVRTGRKHGPGLIILGMSPGVHGGENFTLIILSFW